MPVRRRRTPRSASSCASTRRSTGTATCPGVGPGSATATASTAPRTRRRATASTRQAPDRPVRQGDRGADPLRREARSCRTCPAQRRTSRDDEDWRPRSRSRRDRRRVRLGGRRQAAAPWHETVIYELHVKGFTKRNPDVREDLRGTYAGLASEAAIGYLATSASPRSSCCRSTTSPTRTSSSTRGLTNYWGYSSIGFLAPHAVYAATGSRGEQVREFKGMVKALHRAGIEVILDVVYNHTAEGNHLGPMLVVQGRRQRLLLPARARRPAPLHGLHGHGQHAQPGATRRCCG